MLSCRLPLRLALANPVLLFKLPEVTRVATEGAWQWPCAREGCGLEDALWN